MHMGSSSGYSAFDVVGIGFGPAGIALAAAIEDWSEANGGRSRLRARFCERRPSNSWHPEFLLDGTDINHHFLRDLATPRDPRSRFTFVNYLKHTGRLYDFGLLGRPASRREWAAYVGWVADQLQGYVNHGEPVERIDPVFHDGSLMGFDIATPVSRLRAVHLVISTGAEPFVPEPFRALLGPRVFHTSQFLSRIGAMPDSAKRMLVVGGGQSAGEAIFDLRQRFPRASIIGLQRSFGFKLYDLGHFSNQVYGPDETEYFYNLPEDAKPLALAETLRTNYSGLDFEISSALYSQMYEDRVAGTPRISLLTRRRIVAVGESAGSIRVTLADVYTGETETIEVDIVVLGTGYYNPPIPSVLGKIERFITRNELGAPVIGRDYRLSLETPGLGRIYLNGLCERSHGISDGQSFSLVAVRAEAILKSVLRPSIEAAEAFESGRLAQLSPGHA
jgi:L-ornithine N5-monooxygenase